MGSATVTDATDLMVMAVDEQPAADTRVDYTLTMPGGGQYTVASGQPLRLPAAISGDIQVTAKLAGSAANSPSIWPGAQLLAGHCEQTGSYYARSIPALDAVKALVIYDALVPSGAGVTPEIQLNGGAWTPLTGAVTVPQGDGVVEYSYSRPLSGAQLIKLRLTLSGNSNARPTVKNIRLMALK